MGRPPVRIVPYNPDWPLGFESEAKHLGTLLRVDFNCRFEHIGSTSIPEMGGRPIIDVAVVVREQEKAAVVHRLLSKGYHADDMSNSSGDILLKVGKRFGATIHVFEEGSDELTCRTIFRDHLIASEERACAYYALLCRLQIRHGAGSRQYKAGKVAFIEDELAQIFEGAKARSA